VATKFHVPAVNAASMAWMSEVNLSPFDMTLTPHVIDINKFIKT